MKKYFPSLEDFIKENENFTAHNTENSDTFDVSAGSVTEVGSEVLTGLKSEVEKAETVLKGFVDQADKFVEALNAKFPNAKFQVVKFTPAQGSKLEGVAFSGTAGSIVLCDKSVTPEVKTLEELPFLISTRHVANLSDAAKLYNDARTAAKGNLSQLLDGNVSIDIKDIKRTTVKDLFSAGKFFE